MIDSLTRLGSETFTGDDCSWALDTRFFRTSGEALA